MAKLWVNRAVGLLSQGLQSPKTEHNELDWKTGLSPDKRRLAEHLIAFANYARGGFLVFGINSKGDAVGIGKEDVERITSQLANIARHGIDPPLTIDVAIERFDGNPLLFVHVTESDIKPVRIRGKSLEDTFVRSGGTTRSASRAEIGNLMLNSRLPRWEDLRASVFLEQPKLFEALEFGPILEMLDRPKPANDDALRAWLVEEGFVIAEDASGGYVTNLGAIAAASHINDFPDLSRKAVRVIVYDGVSKTRSRSESEGNKGYAIRFQSLLKHIGGLLPQSEVIEQALRQKRTVYPEIALREIIANALIHQDFSVQGAGPLIEIFDDRLEVSSPGGLLPSKQLDRLIGTLPESRNERLARAFRRYKICEERGSGLQKAGEAVEIFGLPPIRFEVGPNFVKVTLFAPRTFSEMTPRERLECCYQHSVLRFLSGQAMTNTSLRERLKLPERQRSMVSALIQEALVTKLIKTSDPENISKKFAQYIPYWG